MVDGYDKVAEGVYCEIWFARKAFQIYRKAPPGDRARMDRILNHLSENGFQDLNETQFKTEGRFRSGGGTKMLVYAVKSYQLRLYGCFRDKSPRKFIVPEGAIKKENKADQNQLKRVAEKVGE